jgi:hypothetical protein
MQDLMPPVNTPDKLFHDGDPTQGIEGTIVTAEWLNNDQSAVRDVQGELIAVLAEAAMTPDPEKQGQLIEAIKKIVGDGVSDGALLKTNNLSDLVDNALAREHLQLKAAATKDVTTQHDDTNGGRLMTLGCRGIGGGSGDMLPGADIDTAAKYLKFLKPYGGGIYRPIWNSAVTNPDGLTKYSVNFFGNTGDTFRLISIDYNTGKVIAVGANQAGIDAGKVYVNELYGKLNKPNAADVGALPAGGGRLTGVLEIYSVAPIIQLTESDTGKKYFLVADGSGFRINEDSTGGNAVLSYAGASKQLKTVGQFVPGDFANFDARYQAKGNYTPAGQAYTKAESDGRYQVKGNYTPIGTAYTKAESDARYSLKNTATKAANAMTSKDASTGVMEVVMSNITVAANTNVSVTFSTAFPSVCVGVVIAYDGAGHGNDSDSSIAVASYTRTGCVLRANNANGKFMLIAKGY